MTMELPLEDVKERKEEKESAADAENTDVITESTTAEGEQEKTEVPEAIRVQEEVPEAIRVQEEVPEAIRVQEEVPEAIRVQEEDPEAFRVQEEDPEAIRVQEEDPEVIRVKEEVPEAIHEPEKARPPQTEDDDEAPKAIQEKQETVLNLNNEVVKMRKEVKRVRTLILRKLTRQIGALKKKKGRDADIERNQRRAARLLDEIHAIKNLVPDLVTKTALHKNLNFDQVCKDPKSTISDRAIARVATHPQFNKKIEAIKAAVKAFKDERINEGKPGGKIQKKADKTKKPPAATIPEKESNVVVDKAVTAIKSKKGETVIVKERKAKLCHSFPEEKVELTRVHQTETRTENPNKKQIPVKNVASSKSLKVSEEKKNTMTLLEVPTKPDMEAESDLEVSESEEKEYFDDSTEERFHKQSSGESEESDNDFFLGKVSKLKKKKTKTAEDKIVQKTLEGGSNKLQSELDELESRLKSKGASLNSVFCASLGGRKTGKGERCTGREKWKDGARGNGSVSNQTKFQKQPQRKPEHSDSKYNSCPKEKSFVKEDKKFERRRQGKEHMKPKNTRGSIFTHEAPQQPLHPSWEASKKRKEQQGQILAFQGKKIKFDDDD